MSETVSVCIVFRLRATTALFAAMKRKELYDDVVGIATTKYGVWLGLCMIGNFMFPLGRQSAAAGLLCFLRHSSGGKFLAKTALICVHDAVRVLVLV